MVLLNYGNDVELNACIILPDEKGEAAMLDVVETLFDDDALFSKFLQNHDYGEPVKVSIPSFKLDTGVMNLNNVLQEMGIVEAFVPDKAEFNRMATVDGEDTRDDLRIGDVLHRVVVDFNEEGTTAAAVTAIEVTRGCAQKEPDPIEFKVDRPFIVTIQDRKNDCPVYFMIMVQPTSKEDFA